MMGLDIPNLRATIYDSGDQPYEATNVRQIGRAVAGILKHPEETKNKYIYVNSFTVTQNQVLAAIEKTSGKKLQVSRMTTEDLQNEGHRNAEKGNMNLAFPQVVTAVVYGYGGMNNYSANREMANKLLGLPEESLEKTIEEVVKEAGILG